MLHEWTLDDCLEGGRYPAVVPKIHRAGIYFVRRAGGSPECWFELADGRAFEYSVESFVYELELLNASRLNARQGAALRELVAQRLATKEQLKLLHRYDENQDIARSRLNAQRAVLRIREFKRNRIKPA